MSKFIEVSTGDSPVLLNLCHVLYADSCDDGNSIVYLDSGNMITANVPYDEMRRMISNATGGIPVKLKWT